MPRRPGLSVRLKLTLSYVGFLVLTFAILLVATWVFLLRGYQITMPRLSDFRRALDPGNFGPQVFVPAALLALVFLLVFGLVAGWFLAGRMLAPLTRITEATRETAAGSLSHRIGLEGRDNEFHELADAFDSMLARIEAHVTEQQRFAANASHELRTPLAITQSLLDVARRDPHRDTDELIGRLQSVNARAIELTEALLLLSRADRRAFTPEPCDLSLAAEEAVETLHALADRRRIALRTSTGTALTIGSPPLLLQLATNLTHNAIVHNTTGGTVWITTATDADAVVLTVENTGAPIRADLVDRLHEPFQRGHSRTPSAHGGVGLGLAIVARIAEAHHGTLDLGARPEGGLRASVRLRRSSEVHTAPSGRTLA